MAKIPIILEPGRADGKLATSGAIFDENKGMFQSEINDIQDTLNSDNPNKPLSAKQGKILKELLDAKVIEAGNIPIDTEPIEENTNHVISSDAVYKNSIAKKQRYIDTYNIGFNDLQETTDYSIFNIIQLKDKTNNFLGYTIQKENVNSYTFVTIINIPAGTTIINKGVPLILASDSNLSNRYDILTNATYTTPIDIHYIKTQAQKGNVDVIIQGSIFNDGVIKNSMLSDDSISTTKLKDKSVTNEKIKDGTITNNNLQQAAITSDKIAYKTIDISNIKFIDSKNKIDNNLLHLEQYCTSNVGNKISYYHNAIYDSTNIILVQNNTSYICSGSNVRFINTFDASLLCVRQIDTENKVTIQENEKYIVVTFYASNDKKYQIEEGLIVTDYELYKPLIDETLIPNKFIPSKSITTDMIQNEAVNIDKTSFFESTNLFNKNSEDVALGTYLYGDSLNPNSSYNTTGYIKVKPNTIYSIGSIEGNQGRFVQYYDKNKKYISPQIQNVKKITTNENTYYIRVTFYAYSYSVAQVTEGPDLKSYTEYNKKIPSKYLNISIDDLTEDVLFFLPKHIYVASGRTIELYYEQICLNSHKYNIQVKCDIGKALERKFQIVGDAAHVGQTYTLTVSILNDSQKVLATSSSSIHIVNNILSVDKSVVPFGDSLTNQKPWLSEVKTLSNSKITFVGTRIGHEGRSGGSVNTYMNETEASVYSYDHNYSGAGSTSDVFSESVSYNRGDYCRYNNGNSISSYVFKVAHPAGAWDASHVVNLTETNPFYDWETNSWSLTKYKSRNNINFDAIILFLGTNGINLTPETNPNGALGIKNLIDKIRLEDTTTPIVVINTIFRSNQNGIGNQGNTDGYKAQSAYKFEEDKKILLLAKALQDMIGSYENVYISPCGFTMDSKYVYGINKHPVNPRMPSIDEVYEIYPSDSVHPQTPGYEQIADEIFSTLCYIFNN